MESIVFLLLTILGFKIFAILKIENVKTSFLIASVAEILYLGIGFLGSYALSASILHLEYQVVFRVLAILILFEYFRHYGEKLDNLKGVGFNLSGVIFGFAIFGSLGVSLITSKQLILNALSSEGLWNFGYLIVLISLFQAYYLITLFENIVFKKGSYKKIKFNNTLSIAIFTLAGIGVFILPQLYLIIPGLFSNIDTYHLSLGFDINGIRGIFALIFAFISFIVFVYSFDYIKKYKKFYYLALFVLGVALIELTLSDKFESFYLFWELMTISSYLLIMHNRSDESIKAAKIYFLMCIGGAYLLQLAFSSFYIQGIDEFSKITSISLDIAIILFLGFGVKAGIVPLHKWLPLAHPAAPSSISAPLSGILTKAGVFGIIVVIYFIGFYNKTFSYLLVVIGLLTLFYGEIKTLYEKDIKRFFAYSTIGQIGEIVTILGVMNSLALTGALYHIINHAVVKDLLFLSAGILILSAGSRNLDDLKGIGKKLPLIAFPLGVGIFAIGAFPPFGNFNSKFLMIYAAIQSNNFLVGFGLIIGSIIGFIAMLRVFKIIFLLNPKKEFVKVGGIKLFVVYVLSFVSFLLGIFGKNVIDFIALSVNSTLNINSVAPEFILQTPISIVILVIGAIFVYFCGKNSKNTGILAASFSFLAFLFVLNQHFSLNTFFASLVLFMAILNFIYAAKYMDHSHKPYRFFTNFMIMIIGIIGVSLSDNIYSMFFYWEIMGGWALYIALVHEEDSYSIREGSKYLIYNFAGAGILMIGLSVIMKYGFTFEVLKTIPLTNIVVFGIVLLTIGFLAKAAQLPIRIDYQMHPKPAPTPISGYISAVMLKTGPLMLVTLFYLIAAGISLNKILAIEIISHFAAVIGVITIIMGAAFGLLTNSMKRLLIFLTVSEIGYIIASISLVTSQGLAGGILHLINHMFFKDLLFLSAGAIFYKTGIDSLDKLGGIARKMPITFGVFMIAVFSTAGVPMFSGFVSKWMIYHALIAKGYVFLAILTLLGSVMILLVFVKFMHSAYFGKMDKSFEKLEKVDLFMSIPMIILAILNIILGIFPYLVLKPINLILESFGFSEIYITLTSVSMGGDTLNLVTLAFYLLLALGVGYLMFLYNKKTRKTHIFLSGVRDLSEKELHIKSNNFYESVTELINKIIQIIKMVFGLKGGYIER
ncbi:proton-conducting transporter membrane subunit [Caminibacter profundus]